MRTRRIVLGVAMAAAVAGSGGVAVAAPVGTAPGARALPPLDPGALAASISGLPNPLVTGAMVDVSGPAGSWRGTSGVGNVATGAPVPQNGRFRIGSISKVFTAVVILQLAGEGRIDLDLTVQHYMPGLLPASYPPITVRQILNHTSGLPDGTLGSGDARWYVEHRFESWSPRQIVADAVSHPMLFTPGSKQEYNGTNYFVAGLLIEKVTGRSYAHEVGQRIIRPLRLRDTFVLDRHDPRLPGPHSHGYVAVTENGTTTLHDVSEQSPYPWAEGGMISSSADLTTFISAIFRGRIVPKSELPEMFTVPKVDYIDGSECNIGPDAGKACYSVGIMKGTLPNGVTGWGKTGSRPGYTSGVFASRDLSRVLVYSLNPTGDKDGSELPFVKKVIAATFDPGLTSGH